MTAAAQTYFGTTQAGNSKWYVWLAGFWFALALWVYGQMIFGTGAALAGMAADPEGMNAGMAKLDAISQNAPVIPAWVFPLALGAPIAAFAFYFLGRASETRQYSFFVLAGIAAAASMLGIFNIIMAEDSGELAIMGEWMRNSPIAYMFILLTFPPFMIGLWLAQKHLHRRPIRALHTGADRFRWRRLFFTMIVYWAILAVLSLIASAAGWMKAELVFDAQRFWMFLPVTLLFIPLQSATEEIALRGYLNQGLIHFLKNPWIVFVLTSAAFAFLHIGNPEVAASTEGGSSKILSLSGYFLFGIFACLISYIDGGLESAIGMHAANNMFAAAILGYDNSAIPTPTVYKIPLDMQGDMIATIFALSLLTLILWVTRRRISTH